MSPRARKPGGASGAPAVALTVENAQRRFLAVVWSDTEAFTSLRARVLPKFTRAVEALSGVPHPFPPLPLGTADRSAARPYTVALAKIPQALLPGGVFTRPERAELRPLHAALERWGKQWPFLMTSWGLEEVLFTLFSWCLFGADSLSLPSCVGTVYAPTLPDEPIKFERPAWFPTPVDSNLDRARLRAEFELYLDEYEARRRGAFGAAGGEFAAVKRAGDHFSWLVARLIGTPEAEIAEDDNVSKAVVSRETTRLARLLGLVSFLDRPQKLTPS